MGNFEDLKDSADASIRKLATVAQKIQGTGGNATPDELKQLNNEASRLQRDAEATIRKLETEAKGSAPSVRRGLLDSISSLKANLNKSRDSVQKANDASNRGDLLGKSGKQKKMEAEAADKLAGAADTAARGTMKLQQATQVLSESTDIGITIVDTMQQQRESLIRSKDKVSNTVGLTERAKGIMRLMQARAITNKALLVAVVIILLVIIGVVVYFGWVQEPPK